MNNSTQNIVSIPTEWRTIVASILRKGEKNKIQSTQQADIDWQATFPNNWFYERHNAMAVSLETEGIMGRHITDMVPICDAYEFWFNFQNRKILGKIGLLEGNQLIIIFSSHIPRKGDKL